MQSNIAQMRPLLVDGSGLPISPTPNTTKTEKAIPVRRRNLHQGMIWLTSMTGLIPARYRQSYIVFNE